MAPTVKPAAGRFVRVRFDDIGACDGLVTEVCTKTSYRVFFPYDGDNAIIEHSQIVTVGPHVLVPKF